MLDELTEEEDGRIAAHIVALHRDPGATISRAPFTMEQLQRYIKYARAIKPRLTPAVSGSSLSAAADWRSISSQQQPGGCRAWPLLDSADADASCCISCMYICVPLTFLSLPCLECSSTTLAGRR